MNEQSQLHDNAEQQTEQSQTPPIELAGDLLRKQRLALGISQKQVADRLRLRETTIDAIDKNEFDLGQVDTFVKGYLRSYAKIVGLKEHDVLAAYEQHNPSAAGDSALQSFSRKTKNEKHDNNLMRLTYVIVIILIGISSLWWWQSQQNNGVEIDAPQELVNEQSDPAIVPEPVVEITAPASNEPASPSIDRDAQQREASVIEQDTQPESVTEQSEPEAEVAEAPVEIVEDVVAQTESPEPQAPVEVSSSELFMTFTADCWIQVKDATGKVLSTGVKKAGNSFSLDGEKPYSIILGAPEGVEMRLASEPVDLSGYTAGKVARFTLP
jgi:cytoskeleton protein RodZ